MSYVLRFYPDAYGERPDDPDAPARLDEALEGGVRHIGFKDVGLPLGDLRGSHTDPQPGGAPTSKSSALTRRRSRLCTGAVALDVDCLLGGTRATVVTEVIRDHPIRYYPFPGHTLATPASSKARKRRSSIRPEPCGPRARPRPGPSRLPLLVATSRSDATRLRRRLEARHHGGEHRPGRSRIAVAEAGAAGFTVGTRGTAGSLSCRDGGLRGAGTRAGWRSPPGAKPFNGATALGRRRPRKPEAHLRAWVLRHGKALAGHRMICTGAPVR